MRSASETLHHFWFESVPATRLAILRILIGAFVIWFFAEEYEDYLEVSRTDVRLFAPVGVIFHGPIQPELFQWLMRATLVGAVAFTLGIAHRILAPLFACLLLWMLCYRNSWSMIYHSDNLVVLHVLILGFTRSADAFSFDSMFRDRNANGNAPLAGWEYNWPIKLICAVTVFAYFVTAVAKLSSELGIGWMSGENLRAQMAVDGIRKELLGSSPNPTAYAIYDWLPLFSVLAVGSLCLELFAPAALLHRRAGQYWAIGAFLFHWGILAVMNIKFHYQLAGVMFASFFPLERVLDLPGKLRRRRAAGTTSPDPVLGQPAQSSVSRATLYYDGDCALCDRFVQFVLRHDRREYFQFATLQSPGGRQVLAQLGLPETSLQTVVLAEGGGCYVRSTAALRVCRRLAGPWPLLHALILVPRPWRDGVYNLVERNRKRWFQSTECPVMRAEWRRRFIS